MNDAGKVESDVGNDEVQGVEDDLVVVLVVAGLVDSKRYYFVPAEFVLGKIDVDVDVIPFGLDVGWKSNEFRL